ncbi:hypothetical protein ABPG74_002680 [Tetrahymena malaccensis]
MDQLQVISEPQANQCLLHKRKQIEYISNDLREQNKMKCYSCILKSNTNACKYVSIQDIKENEYNQPIQNWPILISDELKDYLATDKTQARNEMQLKVINYFKELQSSIFESIEKQQEQTFNILKAFYDEIDQKQSYYNAFFQIEKLHSIFEEEIYSENLLTELINEIDKTKIKNLEYLEKSRKIVSDFEKKIFHQPKQIQNAVNNLILNIDFFDNQEIKQFIPNYNELIQNKNIPQNTNNNNNTLLAEQIQSLVNINCLLHQQIPEGSQIIKNAQENSISLFKKQLNELLPIQPIEDIANQIKRIVQNSLQDYDKCIQQIQGQLSKDVLFQEQLGNYLEIMNQVKANKQTSIARKQYINNQFIMEMVSLKLFKYLFPIYFEFFNADNFDYHRIKVFKLPYPYQEIPFSRNYQANFSNMAQVDICSINMQKTYKLIFNIDQFQQINYVKIQMSCTQNTKFRQQDLFQQYYANSNGLYEPRINIVRGNLIKQGNIPKYLEMRFNISQQYVAISDYPFYKNINFLQCEFLKDKSLEFIRFHIYGFDTSNTFSLLYFLETDELEKF